MQGLGKLLTLDVFYLFCKGAKTPEKGKNDFPKFPLITRMNLKWSKISHFCAMFAKFLVWKLFQTCNAKSHNKKVPASSFVFYPRIGDNQNGTAPWNMVQNSIPPLGSCPMPRPTLVWGGMGQHGGSRSGVVNKFPSTDPWPGHLSRYGTR